MGLAPAFAADLIFAFSTSAWRWTPRTPASSPRRPARVFNSGRGKKSEPTDKTDISGISEFFIFIFIFYVYFLNLFFSETNIQKINFGR